MHLVAKEMAAMAKQPHHQLEQEIGQQGMPWVESNKTIRVQIRFQYFSIFKYIQYKIIEACRRGMNFMNQISHLKATKCWAKWLHPEPHVRFQICLQADDHCITHDDHPAEALEPCVKKRTKRNTFGLFDPF